MNNKINKKNLINIFKYIGIFLMANVISSLPIETKSFHTIFIATVFILIINYFNKGRVNKK